MAKKAVNLEVREDSSKNLIVDAYTNFSENTFYKSPQVPNSYKAPYNSDDLWQRTASYKTYETMVNDDQVSACLQLKKDLILGSGFSFVPEDESQAVMADELMEYIGEHLENDQTLDDKLEGILTASEFGLSITEPLFKTLDNNQLVLKDLKTRHPNTFLLHQDDYGNVTRFQQQGPSGCIDIEPKKLIHYVNKSRFQNPYGTSDLRSCYQPWFAKVEIIKYFSIFLEGNAKPIPVAKYPINSPKGTADSLLDIIKDFQVKTAIAIPKEVEIEFLQTTNKGEAYHLAINLFNMFIGRSLFVPDLMGMSGSETSGGSFALGKEQMNIFFMHINRRRKALEKIINKRLVWPLVQWNYGNIPNYPKFKFNPLDDEAALGLAKVWLEAVKGKTYLPNDSEIQHFRKLVKFPEGPVKYAEASEEKGFDEETDEPKKEDPKEKSPKEEKEPSKKEFKVFDFPAGDYHRKCDFSAIKAKLDDYDGSVLAEAKPLIQKIYADLYEQLKRKKILETGRVERADGVQLKHLAELKKILKASFTAIYKDGQVQAQAELMKSNFKSPVASQEFLDLLETETFNFIGDWKYNVLKRVKTELISAVKDGKPLSTVQNILDTDGKALTEVALERFARTKHTEVLNKGRLEFFKESGVISGYQYSAILDDRTSEICRGLHGKKFKSGDEPVPPMHFNCRSILIPITKYEEFEPSESVGKQPIESFIEENKGTGFSKYNLEDADFTKSFPDESTEVIIYSVKGTPVQKVTVTYTDGGKTNIVSKITEELREV